MYNITVKGYHHSRIYKNQEVEMHDEFFVKSLDMFFAYLKGRAVDLPKDWDEFLSKVECSYERV